MKLEQIDLNPWHIAQKQAREAERVAAGSWLRLSTADSEFLRLRSREMRIRADCMLADLVALCRGNEAHAGLAKRRVK